MDVLVFPSTHEAALAVKQSLASLLTPHYLPQVITPAAFASPAYPWHTTCALLVLLGPPGDHIAVKKYVENGGKVLAFSAGARQSQGLFGLYDTPFGLSTLFGGGGLLGWKDPNDVRITAGHSALHIQFSPQPRAFGPATVTLGTEQVSVSRLSAASFDVNPGQTETLSSYATDNSPACVLSLGRRVAVWSCAPSLAENLLGGTLTALGLQLSTEPITQAGPSALVLPQFFLVHPSNRKLQELTLQRLFPEWDLYWSLDDSQSPDQANEPPSSQDLIFSDEADTFHFILPERIPSVNEQTHPISAFLPPSHQSSGDKHKDIIVLKEPLTTEQEHIYTPLFSPSLFFAALDQFRDETYNVDNSTSWRIGDVLFYGEVVTSTQSMLDKNPKFLRALFPPILSLASKQLSGRGRGSNTWLSPPGCMLMSLSIRVPLKDPNSDTSPSRALRASNLVFVQYLFALAVSEGCHTLDPSGWWADKVKLKWPNDIYGEFPSKDQWRTSELKKIGGILVNLNFGDGLVDIVVGCGLNVLNEPPVASLAQLEALGSHDGAPSQLRVERVSAAILASFERVWESFLETEDRGFEPFLDRYTSKWVHSNQIVTVTTRTPHITVRIQGVTTDHGLLRTVPVHAGYGSHYIDLQPDGNSFDMMKGLIKVKET